MKSLGQSIREGIGNYATLKEAGEQSNLRKLQAMLALAKIGQMGQPVPQGYSQYGGKLYPDIGEQLKMLGSTNIIPNQNQETASSSGIRTLNLPTFSRGDLGFRTVFDPRTLGEMKTEQQIKTKELSSAAQALPKLEQAEQAAKQLRNLYYQSVSPQSVQRGDILGGFTYKALQTPSRLGAWSGANPELSRYLANRKGFAGLIAKGGFGEAGMLTNQDIQRIVSILPTERSTKEEAEIAWNEIDSVLSSARKRFETTKKKYGVSTGSETSKQEDPLGIL